MNEEKFTKVETKALHAGQVPDIATLSRGVPVYRTTSYVFRDTKHAADLFSLKELGNIYTRLMNPTHDILEKRIASLENGAAALTLSSGTAAIFNSIVNLCKSGDNIVSSSALYGGSYTMFNNILPQFNIKVNFVDISKPDEIKKAIDKNTKAVFTETIGNPSLEVADLEMISSIAHDNNIPLIVDSTFTTPYLLRPIEHGADIVCHSLTKWLGGHGSAIGGIVVDSGKFDWKKGDFPLLNEPDASYHNIRYTSDLGDLIPLAFILRMRLVPLRNLGACNSPDNAWISLQGIETLPLRMERHSINALKVAKYLSDHDKVTWVHYPGLPNHASFEIAKKYLKNGFGGMVVFGIKGGSEAGEKFINKLELFSHLANVGDAKSLAIHPASTTHSQLTEDQQKSGGITPDLIRLSVGIENIEDIIADLESALENA
ncbi:MAG: O-acetylhomoserine aminocarboxypropyltransferase/cysteine synthase [Candidatus Aureabacteria bacterium]|nr:O-acetylhomoserine aminocarboxypropyltransferase/cysteine synthase [Candidatus Auribacterota bacterium]